MSLFCDNNLYAMNLYGFLNYAIALQRLHIIQKWRGKYERFPF